MWIDNASIRSIRVMVAGGHPQNGSVMVSDGWKIEVGRFGAHMTRPDRVIVLTDAGATRLAYNGSGYFRRDT